MDPVRRALKETSYNRLARETSTNPAHVSRIFRGLRRPSLDYAHRLAGKLGVTIEQLYQHLGKLKPCPPVAQKGA